MGSTKTDNHDPRAKLELRCYFLRKYHGADDPPNVLDCCQGSGLIWNTLRREFELAGYWGLDMKPKPGRLKIDSVRVLQQTGWPQNVIDIDTYGSPFKHYIGMQLAITKPITVFMTIGQYQMGTDKLILQYLGSGPGYRPMPHEWPRDMRARCEESGTAFFFKQSAAPRTEMGINLDGKIVRQYPKPRVPVSIGA